MNIDGGGDSGGDVGCDSDPASRRGSSSDYLENIKKYSLVGGGGGGPLKLFHRRESKSVPYTYT